ncbi:unnamed protein product [Pedinophyceae sp. YPF-701]|nr:unnamed protein product [Pedinophyceae sp. YPF-701]
MSLAAERSRATDASHTSKGTKRTFTAAPNVPFPNRHARENHSFLPHDLEEINRANKALVDRISEISTRPGEFAKIKSTARGPKESSQAINRRKQAEKIAQENLAMFKRLQATKPSADLNRKKLAADAAKNAYISRNMQKTKPKPDWQE